MQVWSLGGEDPLQEETATLSSVLAWKFPWTEEPGGLQSTKKKATVAFVATVHKRVGHDLAAKQQKQIGPMLAQQYTCIYLFIGCATRLSGS